MAKDTCFETQGLALNFTLLVAQSLDVKLRVYFYYRTLDSQFMNAPTAQRHPWYLTHSNESKRRLMSRR